MKFIDALKHSLDTKDSHVCVGLDSRWDRIPAFLREGRSVSDAIFSFNKRIVDATWDIAVIYKINVSFYAGFGAEGLEGLRRTNAYIKEKHPDILLFADSKRSEMGESVRMVAGELFDWLGFDCVLVTPWFGSDTVRDYLADETKGALVFVHDSNPSAPEIQHLVLADGRQVYEEVARLVAQDWNINGNLIAEAGATYIPELRRVREIVGEDMPLLAAGVGAQGASPADLKGLFGKDGRRLMVNSSRGIIFPGHADNAADYFADVRAAAQTLRDALWAAAER
ncbi:MAG: orotidine-5'-phosphate decarboxylase [Oscillospiraceae bacterium]|nr:orotidine-5'-phosphate decarboxylase [Oscillospiraceae bacterium]